MTKATILAVEDSKFFRDVLVTMLSANDRIGRVVLCDTGQEALKLAQEQKPDLVLLNIMLPDMNGFELCRKLKNGKGTSAIPVIFLTSSHAETDLSEGFQAGAVDYLLKPFRATEINARINLHLDFRRVRDELVEVNQALREANLDLLNLSQTDPLTKIANRRRAMELIQSELARTARYQMPLSLVLLDIDHFKQVNDTYGHAAGDEVLKELAQLLTRTSRRSDTPARWGGEEFLVLLTHTNHAQAALFAGRVQKALSELEVDYQGQKISIKLTMGIAEAYPNCSMEELIELADKALYYGKEHGRNCIIDGHELPGAPQPLPQVVMNPPNNHA